MLKRKLIKEHKGNIRLSQTQIPAGFEHKITPNLFAKRLGLLTENLIDTRVGLIH